MGIITPRTFKGTRDFLPAEMLRREQLFEYLRTVYQRYGFAFYQDSLMTNMRRLRRAVRPLRWPIRRFMLLHSPTTRQA